MHYFFISDTNNQTRYDHIKSECDRIGLPLQIFPAIMGKDLREEEKRRLVATSGFLIDGEIGCALSHLEVMKRLSESDWPYVVIFEDDITFSEGVTESILTKVADFCDSTKEARVLALQPAETYFDTAAHIEGYTIYSTPRFMGAFGYVVNRLAARSILDLQSPIQFEIDQFKYYYMLAGCQLYFVDAPLVQVNTSIESSIGDWDNDFDDYRFKCRKRNVNNLIRQLSVMDTLGYLWRRMKKHRAKQFDGYVDARM